MQLEPLCECGCGHPAPIAKRTDNADGYRKGEPKRFIHGHHMRGRERADVRERFLSGTTNFRPRKGPANPNWGGGRQMVNGYVRIYAPEHPNAVRGLVYEHRIVAERKLGRLLTRDEQVHHIDGDKANNHPDNLAVMSAAEHTRLHNEMRAAA